jgi:hypothetical protein
MKNKNLLIGAGVVVVGYLLWKKSQTNSVNKSAIVVPQNALVRPLVTPNGDYKIIYDSANFNPITHKSPIIGATIGGVKFEKKDGKYYKQQVYPMATIPMEITEKQWIDDCISKIPFE